MSLNETVNKQNQRTVPPLGRPARIAQADGGGGGFGGRA